MNMKFACEIPGCISKFARKETYRSHILAQHQDIGEREVKELLERMKHLKQEIDPAVVRKIK
jgi:hypothetical protein